MKSAKQLILTDVQRENMHVTYDAGKFCLYCKEGYGFVFLSNYLSKDDLKADLKLNGITNARFNHQASLAYLEQIGAF